MSLSISANRSHHPFQLDAPPGIHHPPYIHPPPLQPIGMHQPQPVAGPSRLNDGWRKRRLSADEETATLPDQRRISLRFRFNLTPTHILNTDTASSSASPSPVYTPASYAKSPLDGDVTGRSTPSSFTGGGRPRRQHTVNTPRRGRGGKAAVSAAQTPRSTRATRSRRQSGTPTTLESIRAEAIAIRTEIARLGLRLRDVTADGNCLFRALADQLWGDQARHAEVRRLVCDHLENHPDDVSAFVAGFLSEGEDYAGYIKRMRGLGVYGGHVELLAAAKVFHRSIRIILSNTSYTVEWESEIPAPLQLNRRTRSNTISGQPDTQEALPYIPPTRPGRTMLWLALFSDAEHYESIRTRGDREIGPAEIEDERAVPHAMDLSEMARRARGEAKLDPLPALDNVLASLPPGHGISQQDARSVLERVKGDLGEAVEILLEMVSFNSGDSDSSDHHVETLLAPTAPAPGSRSTSTAYREPPSPVDTESSAGRSSSGSAGTTPPTSMESEPHKDSQESATHSGGPRGRARGKPRGRGRGKGQSRL